MENERCGTIIEERVDSVFYRKILKIAIANSRINVLCSSPLGHGRSVSSEDGL